MTTIPEQGTPRIIFSTFNDPTRWDSPDSGVISFLTSADVKRAEILFNDMQARLTAANQRIEQLENALREQRIQMGFPNLPLAFANTMRHMIDKALTGGKDD